jgi:hypothetical protein
MIEAAETENGPNCFCCAVYPDENFSDNAMVMFMDYGDAYPHLHAVMKDLHSRLSKKLGHPVSICHNDPTDENVLIHGNPMDAKVYYSDACCKQTTLECYERWVETGHGPGYRPELRSLFFAAEKLAENLNKTPLYVLNQLNWNEDPQAQMIHLLLDYHC